jgi:DNA-binding HxlR family transcriptional regulator
VYSAAGRRLSRVRSHRTVTNELIGLIGGRWTLALLAALTEDGRRFRELHGALNGISCKVLTETLRRAERDGLIGRHLDPDRIESATLYQLSDLGRSLDATVASLDQWIDLEWERVESARRLWDARSSGV